MCDLGFTNFLIEMSTGVSLLRTAESLLSGQTKHNIFPTCLSTQPQISYMDAA